MSQPQRLPEPEPSGGPGAGTAGTPTVGPAAVGAPGAASHATPEAADGGQDDPADRAGRPAPDADVFRAVVARFATGVTVVTTCVDGIDHAMTANAFTSVSLDPLLVLVCVEKEARFHDAVLESGAWTVSILDESGRAAASWFATRGRPLHGQLDLVPHTRSELTGAAVLDSAMAVIDVRTVAVHDGGDHSIVLGEVLGARASKPDASPLLYYRSRYRHLS